VDQETHVNVRAAPLAVIFGILFAVRLTAGAMGLDSETAIFSAPSLPGFEDLSLSPVLQPEAPHLNLELIEGTPADAFVRSTSSSDWLSGIPEILPQGTVARMPLWQAQGQPSADPGVRILTLRVALGGMTGLLALVLVLLVVSFFNMREPANVYRAGATRKR
jgi:hypothetical protein